MSKLSVARFGDRGKELVALTFDDGPNPYFTLQILGILDYFSIKATFFVIGRRCLEYPDILKETYSRGHLIGNHTFSHEKGDFMASDDVINRIIDKACVYVRPPFYDLALCAEEELYLRDKIIVTGDVDSKDYLSITSNEVYKNTIEQAVSGSIIDFHDGSEISDDLKIRAQKTVDALPEIITTLLRNHFSLARIDAMDLQLERFPAHQES